MTINWSAGLRRLPMGFDRTKWGPDVLAGLLGAVLALPQGIAFGTLAGMPPEYGIYTAVVPCIVAALFGSSRHVVSGPTNANSLALFAALSPLAVPGSEQYIGYALAATAIVGIMQLSIGLFRLGWLTDFIPPAVLLGFMSGAALLIGLYALPDLLGLTLHARTGALSIAAGLIEQVGATNMSALTVGLTTLGITAAVASLSRRLPYMLIGIVGGYIVSEAIVHWAAWPDVLRVGTIPTIVPPFSLPWLDPERLPQFIAIAATLSIVALGQSVSIAKALAQRSGQHLDIDREFVGQGLSNLAGSFFSSYVSCGSLNRSLPNYLAGARSSMAAILSAIFLVGLAFVSRPLLERLPMPAIAALLVYIAYGLIDISSFVRLAASHRADLAIAIITFTGMLLLPFQQAILTGSLLSLLLFLRRTARPAVRTLVPDPTSPTRSFIAVADVGEHVQECPQLKLLRIEGAVYFGAAGHVSRRLHALRATSPQKHLLVMVKSMNFIDLAGADLWEYEFVARMEMGGGLYFHRPRKDVLDTWRRTGLDVRLGKENVFFSKERAISKIFSHLDRNICESCQHRIFKECGEIKN